VSYHHKPSMHVIQKYQRTTRWIVEKRHNLLNRTVNKQFLKAKITGIKNNHICLEIYESTPQDVNGRSGVTEINLNNRVIMDDYGDKYD